MEKSKVSIEFLLTFRQSGDVLFFLYARWLLGYTATVIVLAYHEKRNIILSRLFKHRLNSSIVYLFSITLSKILTIGESELYFCGYFNSCIDSNVSISVSDFSLSVTTPPNLEPKTSSLFRKFWIMFFGMKLLGKLVFLNESWCRDGEQIDTFPKWLIMVVVRFVTKYDLPHLLGPVMIHLRCWNEYKLLSIGHYVIKV